MIKSLIQAIPGATKGKGPKCIIRFKCPTESYSQYWSKIMGFLSFLQGLEDLHIQKDTMSMPYVNTMEQLGVFYGELHGLQRQGSIPDLRRSDQI